MPAISLRQFSAALNNVWRPRRTIPDGKHKIGIAVSGGSDSMALASLCAQLSKEEPGTTSQTLHHQGVRKLCFQAFVADHKARPESTAEANQVCKYLDKTGISSEILTLDWNASKDDRLPLERKNFESRARTLRYQALGYACKRHNITSLLLGHHCDDQAETILERIVSGYTGLGLAGIKAATGIPECYGIAGLGEDVEREPKNGNSMKSEEVPLAQDTFYREIDLQLRTELDSALTAGRLIVPATRGLTIHRPLLGFSKSDILSTCRETGISWVDDHTNHDATATIRNTIRYLLREQKLPQALRKDRLLRLGEKTIASTCRARSTALEMQLVNFETRSGTITWRLPIQPLKYAANRNPSDPLSREASTVLAAMTQPAAPGNSVSAEAGRDILERVVRPTPKKGSSIKTRHDSFTIAQTQWKLAGSAPDVWTVSRQPLKQHDGSTPSCVWNSSTDPISASAWQLWDGRYWIYVKPEPGAVIICRPFDGWDLGHLRKTLPSSQKSRLNSALNQAARGVIRFTLPALIDQASGHVLVLPSFNLRLADASKLLDYKIRYKALMNCSTP